MVMVKQEALLLALVTIFCETTSKFHVNTDKNRIVDGAGRERLFHGTNVVQKTAPFIPITTHFDARLEIVLLSDLTTDDSSNGQVFLLRG